MRKEKWLLDLQRLAPQTLLRIDEALGSHMYSKIGGPADLYAAPETPEDVQAIAAYAAAQSIPLLLLGFGSNMIVRDGGFRGIAVTLENMNAIEATDGRVTAAGGASLIHTSRAAAAAGLTGLEFACGIPGSVGGAMAMNAGAYGGEISHVFSSCDVVTRTGERKTLSPSEMRFGYRRSAVSEEGLFVLSATFQLAPGVQSEIDARIADLTKQRESKQPLEYPSVGSVFKRPPGMYAGKLIQDSGLQGRGYGRAEVSTKHAGFIVNKGGATAEDYENTVRLVQREVAARFGVELETEVKIVGEEAK